MKKRTGILFEIEIKGEAKEIPDIGYPIPDFIQNQYELEKLFTISFNKKDKEND